MRGRPSAESRPREPAVPPSCEPVASSGPLPARVQVELRFQRPGGVDPRASPEQLHVVVLRTGNGRQAKHRCAARSRHIAAVAQRHNLRQGNVGQRSRLVASLILGSYRVAVLETGLDSLVGERRPAAVEDRDSLATAGGAADGRDVVGTRRLPADYVGSLLALDRETG